MTRHFAVRSETFVADDSLVHLVFPASQAKENTKVKEAFETLIKRILTKNPKAGQDNADQASGVFGGGKADP